MDFPEIAILLRNSYLRYESTCFYLKFITCINTSNINTVKLNSILKSDRKISLSGLWKWRIFVRRKTNCRSGRKIDSNFFNTRNDQRKELLTNHLVNENSCSRVTFVTVKVLHIEWVDNRQDPLWLKNLWDFKPFFNFVVKVTKLCHSW